MSIPDRVVLDFYAAALDEAPLDEAFGRVAESLGARSGLLQCAARGPDGAPLQAEVMGIFRMNLDWMASYATELAGLDLWRQETFRRPGRVLEMDRYVPPATWENSEIYNLTKHEMDGFHALTFGGLAGPGAIWGFGVHRTRSQGSFTIEQVRLAEAVVPHMHRAMCSLLRQRGSAARRPAQLDAVLASLHDPAMLLGRDHRLRHANPALTTLSAQRDGLVVAGDGSLTLADAKAARMLEAMLRGGLGGELAVLRPSGAPSLLLVLHPLPASSGGGHLVTVLVPDAPPVGDPSPRLRALFGLTAAEARVCAGLLEGLSPQDYAETRRISIHTVRAQIRAALAKTGQDRIGGLMALTARLAR
jgi:DNA-binding CsgD family transcriptional regulator/PAS domain-containing protein